MTETSLKRRTIHALLWSFIQEAAQRILQFGIGIILARLLIPEEFGLMAMLGVFMAVATVLLESGFGSALIQKKELTAEDECSVFYFNVFIGLFLAAVLWGAAPGIARFYGQPQLVPLTKLMSLVLVINGFGVVQTALMVRRLDFRRQAIITTGSTVLSGAVGVMLALRGFGVWSLAVQQVVSSFVRMGLLWFLNAWRPKLLLRLKSLHEMFVFGSGMLASALLNTASASLYPLVMGKLFPAAQVGYYDRALRLQSITSQSLGTVCNRVTFPVFSGLQNEPARMARGLRKAIIIAAFFQFPSMIGMLAIARPMVLFLLTDKWAPCIPYVQLLCLAGLLFPIHLLNLNIVMAFGRSDLFFRLELIKRILLVLALVITCRWGMLAMIWGLVIDDLISYFLNSRYTGRFLQYPARQQIIDFLPYLGAAAIMGLVVWAADLPFFPGHAAQIVFKIFLGVALYTLLCRIMRLEAFFEVYAMARSRLFPRS